MKAARYQTHGVPDQIIEVIDVTPPAPAPGQAVVEVLAAPINPSDLLMLQGIYPMRPSLPAIGGSEGVGRVVEIAPPKGEGADTEVTVSQLVCLPAGTPTWQNRVVVPTAALTVLPEGADLLQLSMLTVNPPTALLMLDRITPLESGDWVVQNAANSGVGNYLIQLAKARGVRTVNVVRRAELEPELRALGADAVLVDGPDLGARVKELTGGGARLGIDAIAGSATLRIAESMADGGVVVNYGVLSGESCRIAPADLLFRGVKVQGFWIAKWLLAAPADERAQTYADLAQLMAEGVLHTAIDKTYALEDARAAVAHAMRPSRSGKIVITPNA